METLTFKAGPEAARLIRREGDLDPARIKLMVGASGGPKWLALARLDEAILKRWIMGRTAPLPLLGSSVGTWRFACYAQKDPLAAFARFEEAYLDYRYVKGQTPQEVSRDSRAILDMLLGESGSQEILSGPMRLAALAVRARPPLSSDRKALLGAGFAAVALANLVDRRGLGLFFDRALFEDPRTDAAYATWQGFPMHHIPLTAENLQPALMASCSIPMAMAGVAGIPGAPPGVYRDGGIIDYHFDVPFLEAEQEGVVLYPHFIDRIIPGWFDKPLGWRRAEAHRALNAARTLLIAPSPDFVARLPHGKIPDRKDFLNFSDAERLQAWRTVLSETRRMADEFDAVAEKGLLPDRIAAG